MKTLLLLIAFAVTPADEATREQQAQEIGRQLRCPVCQGMPISESPATMAQNMMARVRELLAEGKPPAEVTDYFVQRYGDWVLLKPSTQGFNLWVWILPPVVLVLAGLGVAMHLRRDVQHVAKQTASPNGIEEVNDGEDDALIRAVRREVEKS